LFLSAYTRWLNGGPKYPHTEKVCLSLGHQQPLWEVLKRKAVLPGSYQGEEGQIARSHPEEGYKEFIKEREHDDSQMEDV
jgi:hypothetical protein